MPLHPVAGFATLSVAVTRSFEHLVPNIALSASDPCVGVVAGYASASVVRILPASDHLRRLGRRFNGSGSECRSGSE